jgi:RNA polymerase sigma-70 factor, ECF subfamily
VQAAGEMVVDQPLRTAAEDEDQHLVHATLRGDSRAFDTLVQRHWGKVASIAGRFLRDPNDVEDVTQETFVQAYRHLRAFRGQASIQTWLIRITVNVCKNRVRTAWWRRVSLVGAAPLDPAGASDAQALAEGAVLQEQFEKAVALLPDALRVPFVLRFLEDLSGAEIAAALGWNESTVWTRIYAARRELRKRLGNFLEE